LRDTTLNDDQKIEKICNIFPEYYLGETINENVTAMHSNPFSYITTCRESIPYFREFYKKTKRKIGFKIVNINYDTWVGSILYVTFPYFHGTDDDKQKLYEKLYDTFNKISDCGKFIFFGRDHDLTDDMFGLIKPEVIKDIFKDEEFFNNRSRILIEFKQDD